MFDTKKIQRMTEIFQKLPADFDDFYLIPEIFTQEAAALFKRLNIQIRKIIFDTTDRKEIWGIPVVKTADVAETFNERTALIILTQKPVKFIQTTFNFKRGGENCGSSLIRNFLRRNCSDLRPLDHIKNPATISGRRHIISTQHAS